MSKWRAIVWLHFIRLWRLRLSFLSFVLTEVLWILVFILGVLLFIPQELMPQMCKVAFWIIVGWTIISQCSMLIGGWVSYFTAIGMVEEHLLRGVSPFKVVIGRLIPSTIVLTCTLLFMSMLMGEMFGVSMFMLNEPWMLILGLIFMAIQGVAYGVTLASISMRTSIPHSFLDILNFAVMGLLVVPLEGLPEALRLFIVFIPYVAPMQLMKRGISSSFMMRPELIVSCITITSVMILISIWQTKKTERWIRRHGVKGVGFM